MVGDISGTSSGSTAAAFTIGTCQSHIYTIQSGVVDAYDNVIANKVIYDCGTSSRPYEWLVVIANSEKTGFYNNLFLDCYSTEAIFAFHLGNDIFGADVAGTDSTEFYVANNIFHDNTVTDGYLFREKEKGAIAEENNSTGSAGLAANNNINYNNISGDSLKCKFYVLDMGVEKTTAEEISWANWDSVYGQDEDSLVSEPTYDSTDIYAVYNSSSPQVNGGVPFISWSDFSWSGGYDPFGIGEKDFYLDPRRYMSTDVDIGPTESAY